jgi:hypothetical protein
MLLKEIEEVNSVKRRQQKSFKKIARIAEDACALRVTLLKK